MRRARWAAAVALLPMVALTACDESATSPANESLIPPAHAQAAPPDIDAPELPGPRGPAEILALADELNLTDDQRAAIQEVVATLQAQNEPLWEEVRGDGPPRGGPGSDGPHFGDGPPSGGPPSPGPGPLGSMDDPVIREIRANTRAAMEEALSYLTDRQAALFHELRRQRLDRPSPGGGGPSGKGNPGAAVRALLGEVDLTEEQRSQLDTVFTEVHERNEVLRTELLDRASVVGAPGIAGGWDPDDPRVRELRENLRSGMAMIRKTLTEPQWERLQARLRERRGQPPGPGSV